MIKASEIAKYLSCSLVGEDIEVYRPCSINKVLSNSVVFLNRSIVNETYDNLNSKNDVICIVSSEFSYHLKCTYIEHENPRLAFSKILQEFFVKNDCPAISNQASIDSSANIGEGVTICPGVRIGANAVIGNHSIIGQNCVIEKNSIIGDYCRIKPNTTIGAKGFGFVVDENQYPNEFPHIGNVKVGEHVEIGANCTVVQATLDRTVIEDYVKIDDHVHVAHNCHIGKRTQIAAGVILSGSVTIGESVWISPNATIIDYAKIGDKAFIGIGSVVTRNVKNNERVFGIPATPIKKK